MLCIATVSFVHDAPRALQAAVDGTQGMYPGPIETATLDDVVVVVAAHDADAMLGHKEPREEERDERPRHDQRAGQEIPGGEQTTGHVTTDRVGQERNAARPADDHEQQEQPHAYACGAEAAAGVVHEIESVVVIGMPDGH